jgi:hypothetical protein
LRNFSLLHEEGLAPKALGRDRGKGSHRLYSSPALAQSALIGAVHLAGFELLLVAGRLAQEFAEEAEMVRGKLHSNLAAYLHTPFNPTPGRRPCSGEGEDLNLEDDF